MTDFLLYSVRNQEGKWFRRKGYGGSGDTWTDDFNKARIYNRIGPARAIVSWFVNHHPRYGAPQLVALKVTATEVIDEAKRVEEQRAKKEIAKQKRIAAEKEYALETAKKAFDEAKANLAKLSKKK